MLRKSGDQLVPLCIILRRRNVLLIPKGVQRVSCRELLRHEAEFHKRANLVRKQTIIDLVHVREVVHRIALRVLVIHANFILEDGMEANIFEAGDLLDVAQVAAVALAQAQNGAAGTEHLLPEMRERMSGSLAINNDDVIALGLRR